MSGPDVERVRDLLGQIGQARGRLGELAALSEEAFLGDFRNCDSAKYLFIVAIESAIDLCNHLVARLGGRAPQSYADCFDVLAEVTGIEDPPPSRLRRMARFRNLLVHQYWKVDDRQVYLGFGCGSR